MDPRALAERIMSIAQRSGAARAEVFVQSRCGVDIEVRDQSIERLLRKEIVGFGLRVIVDGRMGFVSSSDIRDSSLEKLVLQAAELARESDVTEAVDFAESYPSKIEVDAYDENIETIPTERKVEILKDIESLCYAFDPAISKVGHVGYSDSLDKVVIANTNGLILERKSTNFSVSVEVIAERGGEVETGSEWFESCKMEEIDPPSSIARTACEKAISLLGGSQVPSEDVPVIFDRDTGFAVLLYLFEMIRGENIATGISLLRDRLGDEIGSPVVTIVDDATLAGRVGSREFDDEGVQSRRNVVVDKGRLNGFLFDIRTAQRCGASSTGNANRDDFRNLPGVDVTNFYLEPGDTSRQEIIRSTERGLLVISLAGWWVSINPSTGDFSSGAKGLWLEGGEIAYPVKGVTIASNIVDILANIDAVADDIRFKHKTTTPTFRVSSMKVGGG